MTARDHSHLHALEHGLHNERVRLASAKNERERALRTAWVAQREREVASERRFLGLADEPEPINMTDDELLAELGL
jgi:hypothetical protein